MTTLRRALVLVVLLPVGLATGTVAAFVHQTGVGLVLALLASAAAVWALPGGWWTRLPFVIGWDAALVVLAQSRPEGDYVIAANVHGYVLLGFGVVLLGFAAATLRPLRPAMPPTPAAPLEQHGQLRSHVTRENLD